MYENMNDMQMQAVCRTEGPVLILAGAGSGKTRVLTNRAAYLIEEKGVNPYHIMAITFTNKAAGEMRERIDEIVGFGSESIWVSTFHSACVRILRRHINRIGYDTNFTIYDTDDQKQLMKDICKRLEIDTKLYKERFFLNEISHAKDELISTSAYREHTEGNFVRQKVAQVYTEYQQMLYKNNALDFDDLIMKTVELFQNDREVLEYYQDRLRYLMVDEYQDTNTAQFELIRLLASKYENLCVVGDDDQSIYKFRGANIGNILNFEHYFPNASVIKLEQNYRSTQNILDAANGVIANNHGRKEKALWTQNDAGDKVLFSQFDSGFDEAEFVAADIQKKVRSGFRYQDCAVLYRTNAQSRLFEESFILANIPYKMVGGVNFYARKEIKDLLCYLKTIDNARDDLAVRRVINIPKRGIGAATLAKVQAYANEHEISFYQALRGAAQIPSIGRAAAKIEPFVTFIQTMRSKAGIIPVSELLQEIIDMTGYVQELEAEGTDEARSRIENIEELQGKVLTYEQNETEPTLSGFLEEVALVADIDSLDEDQNRVLLMTLHSAKGLEFPQVYLAGMEDGLFPSYMSITSDNALEEIEEERRLAYVGMTRAMKNLTITCARQRVVRGQMQYNRVSRFVQEIPKQVLSQTKQKVYGSQERQGTAFQQEPVQSAKNLALQQAREMFHGKTAAQQGAGQLYKNPVLDFSTGEPSSNDIHSWKAVPAQYDTKQEAAPAEIQTAAADAQDGDALARKKLGYGVGDLVRHQKFGDGMVVKIVSGGRDFEVTVQFHQAGVKKMFAAFAKLKKIQE
ncbi:MAG: UvrD-helicase domain-containing protein [Eubacterium sp.]|nr:UvrD-helicase domain-containing protein [Eubacterium sp.]